MAAVATLTHGRVIGRIGEVVELAVVVLFPATLVLGDNMACWRSIRGTGAARPILSVACQRHMRLLPVSGHRDQCPLPWLFH